MRQKVQFQTSLFFLKNFILGKSKWSAAKGISGLVVKALRSQSRGPVFKTTRWLQGWLSLSSFQGR